MDHLYCCKQSITMCSVCHFPFYFQANFEDLVMVKTKFYVPLLVCLYLRTVPRVADHLQAFHRTMETFQELGVHMRYGLLEVNTQERSSKAT